MGPEERMVAELAAWAEGCKGPVKAGYLNRLSKRVFEAALEGKMDDHLGYGKHNRPATTGATPVTASGPRRC
jgi:putative transposase